MKTKISSPVGMSGLAVEPWTPGEVYAVAANWAQAGSPIMVYGERGWGYDEHGRQVADFRHRRHEALEAIIAEAIIAGGDEADDAEVAAIVSHAEEIDDTDSED